MNPGGIYGGIPGQQEMGDFAASMAGGVGARGALNRNTSFPTNVAPVAPANVAAPSSFIIALFAMTPHVSGRFHYTFGLSYTDSAADTVLASVGIFTGVTSVSGGTSVGVAPAPVFTWESSPITLTGGSAIGVTSTNTTTFDAPNVVRNVLLTGIAVAIVPFWLVFEITATHNLSAMQLSASCAEF